MKKLLPLFLIFAFIQIFSQEYHFDHFVKRKNMRIKPDYQQWIADSFYDSATTSKLVLNVRDKKVTSAIFQRDKNMRHIFSVIQSGDHMSFVYKYTNKFKDNGKKFEDYNNENVIRVEKIDSANYKITAFKNFRLRQKKITLIITLEKSDFKYTNINADYNRINEMEEKLKELLDPDSKYIIRREQIEYSSGYLFDNSLIDIQKVNLTIKIPEKLILKDYSYVSDIEE
jgi:hypothetical protein